MKPGEEMQQEGEFHHFQLVNAEGEIPMSVSVLIHLNPSAVPPLLGTSNPISADDILEFHNAMEYFDGDFAAAFANK